MSFAQEPKRGTNKHADNSSLLARVNKIMSFRIFILSSRTAANHSPGSHPWLFVDGLNYIEAKKVSVRIKHPFLRQRTLNYRKAVCIWSGLCTLQLVPIQFVRQTRCRRECSRGTCTGMEMRNSNEDNGAKGNSNESTASLWTKPALAILHQLLCRLPQGVTGQSLLCEEKKLQIPR